MLHGIPPLKHSLTTSRSAVIVSQVVVSHLAATTVGKVELPPYVSVQSEAWGAAFGI